MSGFESQLAEIRARQREAYQREQAALRAAQPQSQPPATVTPMDCAPPFFEPSPGAPEQPWLDEDEALARRLQEEEDAAAQDAVRAPMEYNEEPEQLVGGLAGDLSADDTGGYHFVRAPPAPARRPAAAPAAGQGGGWLWSSAGRAAEYVRGAAGRLWQQHPPAGQADAEDAEGEEDPDAAYARRLQDEEDRAAATAASPRPPFRDPGVPLPPDLTQLFRTFAAPQAASTRYHMQSPGGVISFSTSGQGTQRTIVMQRGPNGTFRRVVHNHRLDGGEAFSDDDVQTLEPDADPFQGLDPFLTGLPVFDPMDHMSYEQLLALQDLMGNVPKGATSAQIETLPCTEYRPPQRATPADGEAGDAATLQCHVCLDDFAAGDVLRTLPCLHRFHSQCIDRWLPLNRTCPVCKADVTTS